MPQAAGQFVALACQAMGTRFELLLPVAGAGERAEPALRSAGEAAIEEIERWHRLLSAFDPASVVSRVNHEAAERPVLVPPEVADLLRFCKTTAAATDGAFDPSVGAAMRAAGFRDEARGARVAVPHAMSGVELVEGDGAWRVRFAAEHIALDFGAVGKGWAIDRATGVLAEHGVQRALLHGGTSSVAAIGDCGDGPWRVGTGPGGGTFKLIDRALGMSSQSGRTVRDEQGGEHGHVLDPRTGASASHAEAAVVSGPLSAVCDAWSTALIVNPALVESDAWPKGYAAMVYRGGEGWSVYDKEGMIAGEPASEQGSVR